MKIANLAFAVFATSVCLISIHPSSANSQSANNWVKQALGSYQSRIWSAGTLIPGTTEFRENSDGSIEGSYTMNEQGNVVPGILSECQAIQIRVMRCFWNDRYGTGTLKVTFSEDFSSFNGYWGMLSSEPEFNWIGSR